MDRRVLAGECFCGVVRYAVADEFLYAANCHCSDCRRTTGSAFKPFAGMERNKLTVTQGSDKILIYGDDDGNNTHCTVYGSPWFTITDDLPQHHRHVPAS